MSKSIRRQQEVVADIRRRLAAILAATEMLEQDNYDALQLLSAIERNADECFHLAADLGVMLWETDRPPRD